MDISDLIRQKRKERSYTQRSLAAALGIHHSAVAQWEAGITVPTNGNMARLKVLLGIGSAITALDGRPYCGRLVDDADELAWLQLWTLLDPTRRADLMRTLAIEEPGSVLERRDRLEEDH